MKRSRLLSGSLHQRTTSNGIEEQLALCRPKILHSCGNGTDALSMVLMAWDIKEGDAVIPDFTFFAGEVVSFEGATPVC